MITHDDTNPKGCYFCGDCGIHRFPHVDDVVLGKGNIYVCGIHNKALFNNNSGLLSLIFSAYSHNY